MSKVKQSSAVVANAKKGGSAEKSSVASSKNSPVKTYMYDVILSPVVTEKSQVALEFGKVVFRVASDATKVQIRESVESLFGVKVVGVNVLNVKGKVKRFRGRLGKRKDVKKAVVTLAPGESIDSFSGV